MMVNKKLQIRNSTAEFLIFTNQVKEDRTGVLVEDETVWLPQKLIAILFDVDRTVITKHLKNIFGTYELKEDSVCAFLHILLKMARTTILNTNFYELY